MNRQSKDRVFYTAATQFENLGDIVLAEEVVRRSRSLGALLVDDRDCPGDYLAMLDLEPSESVRQSGGGFKRRLLRAAVLKRLGVRDRILCLLKPGHLRNDVFSVKQFLFVLWLFMLKTCGVEIARYGTSIELPNNTSRWLERFKAKSFSDYTLRDNASIALARDAGLTNVRYFPDLALGLGFSGGGSRPLLCASFRNDLGDKNTDRSDSSSGANTLESVASLLERALEARPDLELVLVSQVYRDDDFNRRIAERFGCNFKAFDGSLVSKAQIYELYSRSQVVMSNRLHALLFGASQGAIPVPVVEPVANAKVVNVLTALGLGVTIFDVSGGADIGMHLNELLSEESRAREQVKQVFDSAADYVFGEPTDSLSI